MQPVNRVLLILILIGVGSYYWKRQQSSAEYDRQVGALASALDRRFLAGTTPPAQAESMFRRALVILSDYRSMVTRGRIGTGEIAYIKDALTAAGYTSDSEITLISRSLRENLTLCEQMKISGGSEGISTLLTGQDPLIRAGSFKGDTLIVGRRVPPALVPDLVNHPANFALTPSAPAALIWPFTLSDATMSAIAEFKSMDLVDAATALNLKQRAELLRNPKP
jgi:hypothetical protein